jgi:nucleoside-diphosphate-sugar epimerase
VTHHQTSKNGQIRPAFYARTKPRQFRQTRFIIAGCGQVGQALLRLQFKAHFTATYRPTNAQEAKRETIAQLGAKPLCADLTQPKQLQRLIGLAQRWIWLAPPNAHVANDPSLKRLVLHLAARTQRWNKQAPAISYISTTGVYGNTHGQWIDEKTPIAPNTERAKRRAQAEQHLRLGPKRGLSIHILRAPGIYSATRLPLDRLRQGTPSMREEDDAYSNHIHETDLARLARWSSFKAGSWRVINACDRHPSKMGDYFDSIADAFKLPRPPRLPKTEVKKQVSPMMWSFMNESRRIASIEQGKLGFKLHFPSVDAFLNTLKPQEK